MTMQTTSDELSFAFTIGDLSCVALSDGFITVPSALLAPEVPAEELQRFLSARGQDPLMIQTPISCLLVKPAGSGRTILVDSGIGRTPGHNGIVETAGRLQQALASAGVAPSTIDTVLVSHIHPDHVGGLFSDDGQPMFPNADYFVSREEADFWGAADPDLGGTLLPPPARTGVVSVARRFLALASPRLTYFASGDDVLDGVGTVPLGGHTPGQVGYLFRSRDQALLFTADASGHPLVSIEKPAWRFSFDTDAGQAIATRERLTELLLRTGWYNFTPHFPWPSVGRLGLEAGRPTWRSILDLEHVAA